MRVPEFIRLAERHGWVHVRTNGSHRMLVKPGEPRPMVVAVHGDGEVPKMPLKRLLKQLGLTLDDI